MRAPDWLGEHGKRKWKQLQKALPSLRDSDADALALLCQSWDDYLTALEHVRQNGQVTGTGRLFLNPSAKIVQESWKQIVGLSKHFGLLPEPKATADEPEELEF